MKAPHLTLLLALAACLGGPASAQVVRCTDPATGKATYTDGECRQGDATREIEGKKTPEELEQEREQAAEALARKHERQQQEALLRSPPAAAPAPRPAAAPPDPAHSAACQQARQRLQQELDGSGRGMYDEQSRLDAARRQADLACLTPAEFARADSERSRAQAAAPAYYQPPVVVVPARPHRPHPPAHKPPPPREMQCNVFRCYDRQGNVYPR